MKNWTLIAFNYFQEMDTFLQKSNKFEVLFIEQHTQTHTHDQEYHALPDSDSKAIISGNSYTLASLLPLPSKKKLKTK